MKPIYRVITTLFFSSLLAATSAFSGEYKHEKKVIMVKSGDAEVIEADVSDLALGESKAFVTESGKAIDILQTESGLELYIDGELQDLGFGDHMLHTDGHATMDAVHEVECESDNEGDCENQFVFFSKDGDMTEGNHEVHVIKKHVEVICEDDQECEEMVWVTEDGEINLDELHEEGHNVKVIRLHKQEDASSGN